ILYVTHAMRRRVYGEELAAEPSPFLNELPLDLIEDMTKSGASWLSFAKNPATQSNKDALRALRGEKEKPRTTYTGKTYNSADAIGEFFKQRSPGGSQPGTKSPESKPSFSFGSKPNPSAPPKPQGRSTTANDQASGFLPGMYVKHAKYGKGLVLRREGTGDNTKLTVSFPGFGQKKLIEKFANLEKA
ncbi:MAG TPA: hypothetical protein VEX64_04055, partial [Pyrinomonadaceae bacterium]|nr:hypothetical protein [Pyrinomonadaceae bacterium]